MTSWRANEASETLSGVTNGNWRYIYIYIYGMLDPTLLPKVGGVKCFSNDQKCFSREVGASSYLKLSLLLQ